MHDVFGERGEGLRMVHSLNEKKRLFLFIDGLVGGGAQRQFVYLAKGLKERGYVVRCFTLFTGEKWSFYEPFLRDNNVDLVCETRAQNKILRVYYLLKAIRYFKPDVVIAYGPLQTIYASICRCLSNFTLISSDRNTTQKLDTRERLRFFFYRYADYIVPNSYSQGEFISKYDKRLAKKVKVITNLVDVEKFSPRRKPRKETNIPHIISVGRFSPQKNYLGLIAAVKLLKGTDVQVHFDWYGNEYADGYHILMKEKIKEYGLEEMITLHPTCVDIENRYNDSDGFCLPSFYEGFPNVLCEAMACGLPVVCSNVCDNPFIVNQGDNGFLCNPTDPQTIADALMKMILMNDSEKKSIGEANRKRIVDLCSEASFLDKYEALIK